MAGRRPKPTALKELTGNPGKRRLNKREPRLPGRPACPGWLSDAAKAEWNEVVPLLQKTGVLMLTDGKALALYCQTYARWMQAEAEIEANGITFRQMIELEGGEFIPGDIKKNPAVTVAEKAKDQMGKFLALFGMDPSSRSRLEVSPADDAPGASLEKFLGEDATVQ